MAACWKCGAEAGFDKGVCSDCSDTASEDNDPASTDTQRNDGEQLPEKSYGCLLAIAIAIIVALVLPYLAAYLAVCAITFGLVCS